MVMGAPPTDLADSVCEALRAAIAKQIEGASVEASGSGGHYSLVVTAPAFTGKGMLECHRLVMAAIALLMTGDRATVHAIDSLKTRAP